MALHRGKLAKHPEIKAIRPLTREDLALLEDKRPYTPGAAQRFRDPHHQVARLFAMGLRMNEVVERCGYSYNRVYQLHSDPAFQDLIAKKRTVVDEAFVEKADEFAETAIANMRKAERMIAERLEKADEEDIDIPLKTLVDISGDRMDRFGYGKRQTNVNINDDFASALEKAIVRSGKATLIEATANPQSSRLLQSPQGNDGSRHDSLGEQSLEMEPAQDAPVGLPALAPSSPKPTADRLPAPLVRRRA